MARPGRAGGLAGWNVVEPPWQTGTPLRRRDMLRMTALVPVTAALTAGCAAGSRAEEPDPLEALVTRARSDAALAGSVARAHPELTDDAKAIASVRTEHADALRREIDRVNPPDPETTTTSKPPPPPAAPSSAGDARAALRKSLRDAQRQASDMVSWAPPYRAGLTGSVSAGCASLQEVLG